jgi:hypothetical protein
MRVELGDDREVHGSPACTCSRRSCDQPRENVSFPDLILNWRTVTKHQWEELIVPSLIPCWEPYDARCKYASYLMYE